MTVHDIYERAMQLLGCCDREGRAFSEPAHKIRAFEAFKTVALDIGAKAEVSDILDEVSLSEKQSEAAVYGVGMMLSLADGDIEKNVLFTELYNLKRAAAKSEIKRVKDTLPKGETAV